MNLQHTFSLLADSPDGPNTNSKSPASDVSQADATMKPSQNRKSDAKERRPLAPLQVSGRLSNLVEEVETQRLKEDLVLSPHNVRLFIDLIKEFQHADMLRRHGLQIRSKILFCGPPGCGKTITAEVFARELKLPLYVAKLDAIVSSFLGETATNLRKLFEEVNRRPCVLFLDEFDALARSRNDETEHSELRRVVNSLLMLIDRYHGRGFVIGATNLDESLDPAVWRRFDEVILFDLPDEGQIRQFVKLKTRHFPIGFDVVAKISEMKGMSYADIERICLNAIKHCLMQQLKHISEPEFDAAILEEKRRQRIKTRLSGNNY